jgi:SSS family solute:Na+ symporter
MNQIHNYLVPLDFIIVGIYLLLLIGVGYWISFVKAKQEGENLFLANRSLKWYSIGLNMWGTNVGPSMLVASASAGFTSGMVTGNFAWYAFPFIFLLATVFAPRYLGAQVQTLPEFMGKRFGQSTRNILAWYSIVTILISWLGLTLYSGGILVSQILNFPMWLSILLLVVISAFFAIAGGLKAIAFTNVFQMILLIIVSFILAWLGFQKAGGIQGIADNTPAHYWNLLKPVDDKDYPWLAIALGYPVMGIWFWCTDQSMVQSILGAKNLKQGQLGANFIGWLKILDVALFIIPGICCFVLFPQLKNPDEAYMTMVVNLLPQGMTGLIMAVLIAALISTIDSALNSLSTVFTLDIYARKINPGANNAQIIKTGRWVAVAGAVLAVGLALAMDSIRGLKLFDIFQAVLGFIAPPMAAVFLLGVFWKRTSTRAANFVLFGGTLISFTVAVFYLWIFPAAEYPQWPHFLLLSFYIFCVLIILGMLISLTDKKTNQPAAILVAPTGKTSKQVLIWWLALALVMISFYIIFNGH